MKQEGKAAQKKPPFHAVIGLSEPHAEQPLRCPLGPQPGSSGQPEGWALAAHMSPAHKTFQGLNANLGWSVGTVVLSCPPEERAWLKATLILQHANNQDVPNQGSSPVILGGHSGKKDLGQILI